MSLPLWFGPYGGGDLPRNVKDYGVNAIFFHGFNEKMFNSCADLGIEAIVEFKTFRGNYVEHPELIPTGVDGKPIRYGQWLQGVCMSQSAFLAETEQALIKGLESFKPGGVWLDYLAYGGWSEIVDPDLQESCFCRDCIDDFCRTAGVEATTPAEILGKYQKQWTEHKCRKIAEYGRLYAGIIKDRLPGAVVGCYMIAYTPDEYDGALTKIFAQDYSMLEQSIDVFTPLIYCKQSGRGTDWGRKWLERSPEMVTKKKVSLILDVADFPESLEETAEAKVVPWGVQLYAGTSMFQDKEKALTFKNLTDKIRKNLDQ